MIWNSSENDGADHSDNGVMTTLQSICRGTPTEGRNDEWALWPIETAPSWMRQLPATMRARRDTPVGDQGPLPQVHFHAEEA